MILKRKNMAGNKDKRLPVNDKQIMEMEQYKDIPV
jgi:hypothetical protein